MKNVYIKILAYQSTQFTSNKSRMYKLLSQYDAIFSVLGVTEKINYPELITS